MRSENEMANQPSVKRSFIEDARRAQIIAAAIKTLAEIGYGKASLAQIAKRAEISPSLIPYHFNDKAVLVYETLIDIVSAWTTYVEGLVARAKSASDQLRVYAQANLAYMGARPTHFVALIEILFNARSSDGELLYRTKEEDTALSLLKSILRRGQQTGEFRSFDVHQVALAIRGAIDGFFPEMHKPKANLEAYTAEVLEICSLATRKSATT